MVVAWSELSTLSNRFTCLGHVQKVLMKIPANFPDVPVETAIKNTDQIVSWFVFFDQVMTVITVMTSHSSH
jgi:hypothetical protein